MTPAQYLDALHNVYWSARTYRRAEQDETPRMWRGKKLHDLGLALDAALDALMLSEDAATQKGMRPESSSTVIEDQQ